MALGPLAAGGPGPPRERCDEMKEFQSKEEEAIFLFGSHAVERAKKRGPKYYLKRIDQREFRQARDGLKVRRGPALQRFARALKPEIAGALIHAILDSDAWNRLVIEMAVAKVPKNPRRSSRRTTRRVARRKFITSGLDPDD